MRISRICVVLLLAAAGLVMPSPPASAATFTVTKNTDTNDGSCDADCSLREAIIAANASPGLDTIVVPAGRFTRSFGISGVDDDVAARGDLDVTEDVTIEGAGAGRDGTLIDASGLGARVFHILEGSVTFVGLDITGAPNRVAEGAGVTVEASAELTLRGSRVFGNDGSFGGGIFNRGNLALVDSVVSRNSARVGGGIHNDGTVVLRRSMVVRNSTRSVDGESNNGGGIFNRGGVVVRSSIFLRNTAANSGGGFYNTDTGALVLTDSTVSSNQAVASGGIRSSGIARLTDSTISGNTATSSVGGIFNSGTLMLRRSTVSGNSAGFGGGIFNEGPADLSDSTVSGNSAGFGGGIFNDVTSRAAFDLTRSTVSGNSAGRNGGGIFNNGGTVNLRGAILAGNSGPNPDCHGPVSSRNFNVIGADSANCTILSQKPRDAVGTAGSPLDPLLRPLRDNGGPTNTRSIAPGSPARDRIPASHAACGGRDQRGVPRPWGSGCDTGAYELARCMGRLVTVVGTPGNDELTGTHRPDGVLALAGNDRIRTFAGNDRVCAGAGNDEVFAGSGDDRVLGQSGNDALKGNSGDDMLNGGPGTDVCRGGRGDDTLRGCES